MRSLALTLLWNAAERRPRLPWRLLLGAVVFTLAVFTVFGIAVPVVGGIAGLGPPGGRIERPENVAYWFLGLAGATAVAVGGCALLARFVDRRYFRDFGFRIDRDWWLDLAFGLALGAALMTGIFVLALLAGWAEITGVLESSPGTPFLPAFGLLVSLFVVVGVVEELLFRGYLLSNLAEGLRWADRVSPRTAVLVATVAAAALFGVAHASNPNATAGSAVAVTGAGILLAAGYVLTGELAIPVGLHVSWNLFEAGVYGFPVSGLSVPVSIVGLRVTGPEVVTGGAFGPEAGLLGVLAYVVGGALIAARVARQRGRVRLHPAVWTPDLRDGVN